MTKHIAVLSGKRGGYGAMKPLLKALDKDVEIKLSLILTDQHLNREFGNTYQEVEQDFTIAGLIDMNQKSSSELHRAEALGNCMAKMAILLDELRPDLLLLYGDRGEVLSTAVAAVHLRIPIAHLQGGDLSGNIDEQMRHAITKLSHLHYPSTKESAERIISMGESPSRVKVVGDNHVDGIVSEAYTRPQEVRSELNIDRDIRPIIFLYHPETTRNRDIKHDTHQILKVISEKKIRTIIVYPCSDAGYTDVISAFDAFRGEKQFSFHKNISAENFWGLLNIANLIIGNSSCGLIETPYFGIPAINVGKRQEGRACSSNVIHCEPVQKELNQALDQALHDTNFRNTAKNAKKIFGDGLAWRRIYEDLKSLEISENLFDKRFV